MEIVVYKRFNPLRWIALSQTTLSVLKFQYFPRNLLASTVDDFYMQHFLSMCRVL
jgi:hypothetical protein